MVLLMVDTKQIQAISKYLSFMAEIMAGITFWLMITFSLMMTMLSLRTMMMFMSTYMEKGSEGLRGWLMQGSFSGKHQQLLRMILVTGLCVDRGHTMCKVQWVERKEGAAHKKAHIFVDGKKGCYSTFLSSSSVVGDYEEDTQEVLNNKKLCLHCKNTLKNALKKKKENSMKKKPGLYIKSTEYTRSVGIADHCIVQISHQEKVDNETILHCYVKDYDGGLAGPYAVHESKTERVL